MSTRTGRDGKERPATQPPRTASQPAPGPIVCAPVGAGKLADIPGITKDDAACLSACGITTLAVLEQRLESLRSERGRQNATIYDVLRVYPGTFTPGDAERIGDAIIDHLTVKTVPPAAAPAPPTSHPEIQDNSPPGTPNVPPGTPNVPPDTVVCPHCLGAGRVPKPPPVPVLYNAPGMPDMPPELDTPEFLLSWESWLHERKKRKQTVTPKAATLQLRDLAAHGAKIAIETIEISIKNGWTGLFPGKTSTKTGYQTAEDREAEQMARYAQDAFGGSS